MNKKHPRRTSLASSHRTKDITLTGVLEVFVGMPVLGGGRSVVMRMDSAAVPV